MLSNLKNKNAKTIFIPIAAHQEYFIEHTIKSAIAMAQYPDRIYFGVFNNILSLDKSLLQNNFITKNNHIVYVEVISPGPLGVGFGRMNASLLSTKTHDYIFQIDAHTMFSKNWDSILIDTYEEIFNLNQTNKIVLTGIPGASWTVGENNRDDIVCDNPIVQHAGLSINSFYENSYSDYPNLKNYKPSFSFDGNYSGIFIEDFAGRPITTCLSDFENEYYDEVNALHASMVFGEYSLVRDFLHDPEDKFHGDQINFTLRLLSRGYKIFAVKYPFIMTLNKAKVINDKVVELDPEYNWRCNFGNDIGTLYANELQKKLDKNYKKIFNGEYFGYWGAPDINSLKDAKQKMGFKKI